MSTLRHVCIALLLVVVAWSAERLSALETPASYGEAAQVDTPVLRIPFTQNPPTIDGVMDAGEWEDASALSCFWYDYGGARFIFLAPVQTQLEVYAAFDKENLYIAYVSPVYPENSWLKARARFPDVLNHALYGIQWDDHIELELRPHDDLAEGFRMGLFKWEINPINTVADRHWTVERGAGTTWQSRAKARSRVDGERWQLEIAIPLESFRDGKYAETDEDGVPVVQIPPPDGTVFRSWFTRGISGNGAFFNVYDAHGWNTTKNMLVFDRTAPSFQINDLGPVMEDIIDVRLTVKNHNTRSETVRLGFFVESAEGLVYSSYESPELNDGMLELRPGEVKKLHLQQAFPGISRDGNVLWFDVRSAGTPAKVLFRTRLVRFHSMDGGLFINDYGQRIPFRYRRIDAIAKLRPPRKDFEFRWNFSSYTKRVFGVADTGIHGASEEAKRAVEAKLLVLEDTEDEDIVAEANVPFNGDFACFLVDLPDIVEDESYKLSLLLFDKNKRIVGERNPPSFTYDIEVWQDNDEGLNDVVWEPFTAMQPTDAGFETLRHVFTLDDSGLPAQVRIRPDVRELPLEMRDAPDAVAPEVIAEIGRGDQLAAPFRLVATVDGKRVPATVTEKATLVRTWQSELEYASRLRAGPLSVRLVTQYDCDGAMHCRVEYGSDEPVSVDRLELETDVSGPVDLCLSTTRGGGMTSADWWECAVPEKVGVVWDSAELEFPELYYTHFVPWFWFGNADRAFTFYCDSDEGWTLDRDGTTMQLERNADGSVTWRALLVNHPSEIAGTRSTEFTWLTHPAKFAPEGARLLEWHYRGKWWSKNYLLEPLDIDDDVLRAGWRGACGAPKDWPYEKRREWRKEDPPWGRFGRLRNHTVSPEMDQIFEDKIAYYLGEQVRIGRRVGWWLDEFWPVYRSDDLAMGNAYLRDPEDVGENETPWQSCFLTDYMRTAHKRVSRVMAEENVPNRTYVWANNSATMMESFAWDTQLVEECGSMNRSYELDTVVQYPNSLIRYFAHNWTGLLTRIAPGAMPVRPGDDKRLCRQYLGRALINDMGCCFDGPHAYMEQKEQPVRLVNALLDFGFFEQEDTEHIPFWRNDAYVRFGADEQIEKTYVAVYRRPLADGGVKAIFVVMNESDDDVEAPLVILDPERVLGGPNTLSAGAALSKTTVPDGLADWWTTLAARDGAMIALRNMETGEAVPKRGDGEQYGPVYVPMHDYRVLYAEHAEAAVAASDPALHARGSEKVSPPETTEK